MTRHIKIDFGSGMPLQKCTAQRGDSSYRLIFDAKKYRGAKIISVYAVRADGAIFYNFADISDDAGAYILKDAMCECAGALALHVRLSDSDGGVLADARVSVDVA